MTLNYAKRFVIGPDEATMERMRAVLSPMLPPFLEPSDIGFLVGRAASDWEWTYFAALERLSTSPPAEGALMRVDFDRPTPPPCPE
jgi:hypothetical protein